MKVVFLDAQTLGADFDFSIFDHLSDFKIFQTTNSTELIDRAQEAHIIITNKVVLDAQALKKLPKLKLICIAATGTNNIDLDYCEENNIVVKNAVDYSTHSVTQHTFTMLFHLIGNSKYYQKYSESFQWTTSPVFTHLDKSYFEISGKNWGVIGLGNIGKNVAKIAQAFGCKIQYYSTSGKNIHSDFESVDLETLLTTSDIVSIHAPLNDNTKNLLNYEKLKLLKDEAILLNLGRGGIINEVDLARLLDHKKIGVGLDVLEQEPMILDHPLQKHLTNDNLYITPHIAWASKEARQKLMKIVCQHIKDFTNITH
jgi:lactate dehydrogenase-like 2-hydroxyacid dehydrogenase